MDVDDNDGGSYHSDSTATDPADYNKQGKNNTHDLAGLLADNEHPPEYYMKMLNSGNKSLLQYNEYTDNSPKLLSHIEQE
ncbi:uncharacterized protein BDCG_16629 [Blastomyces dermatitidis ER-3]|uniref:Uncharacterized protein n=3 Tax=Blastomyces TaxID=229219 RepID=A0A179UNF6_BLAGS|nr:uncharacterized protein BDBG_17258 [Blastomyces gilchristii SLH14081]XP_045280200.1 uncharacterized protein BDCG_16629 [Blastomyces dermatitidis ER-3]KMW66924.1 hypothetical protein BDDG_11795 [Blastomyces dermatitidis ATCC 18188]OAT00473.1 hypothetical protein BDCG_16629 [Blastomyces dermatitidis ER-3]OAT09616.1 hypothetical protein BDBG_17258 [Blastomyces gilchristii SLH14081]